MTKFNVTTSYADNSRNVLALALQIMKTVGS